MKDKRITRLIKLLQMLQGGRGQNSAGLAKACGVGRRTIFRDLETLREAGVPLEFDSEAQRYSIRRSAFGPPSDLTAEEAISIWAIASAVRRQQHVPFYEAAHTALEKIERSLPTGVRHKLRKVADSITIQPARAVNLNGKFEIYKMLIEAIEKSRSVHVEYESLTEWEQIATTLHPYHLFFSDHNWYVIGRSSQHQEVRTFKLIRMLSARLLSERFSRPHDFDLDKHVGNSWRMIPEPGRQNHVVVKFGSLVARNVSEVNWHKSQRIKFLDDGSMIFQVTVSGLTEIAWWVLGYGDQAEVIQPAKLRRMVAQRAKNMAAMYADENSSPKHPSENGPA
jgi:predicted DNA-binding transcriptional regulator YafY